MDQPIVEISSGKIQGVVSQNYVGQKFYSFLGIPFAKPPIGDLRFKAPEPVEPWEGVKGTVRNGSKCVQKHFTKPDIEGSEDCLHLNVFTRELPGTRSQLKPVLVFIHGGAFIAGSNSTDMYGPEYLLLEDIVLVTPNYRLGILGFLHLNDQSLDVPGNAGLKDQRLALQWVQQNINKFNGDPNNVTVLGHSVGSISVHYQILSSSSAGLFNKAMIFSGTVLSKWSKTIEFSMEKFLEILNIKVENEKEAFSVLCSLPAEVLIDTQYKYYKLYAGRSLIFLPVIEKPNNTSIITKDEIDLILNGEFSRVPLIVSYASHEGLMFTLGELLAQTSGANVPIEPLRPEQILPNGLKPKMSSSDLDMICSEIEKVYGNQDETLKKCLMLSDYHFIAPSIATAKTQAVLSDNPVYLLKWSIDDDLNLEKRNTLIDKMPGACHGDELGYIFKNKSLKLPAKGSSAEKALRKAIRMIGNFCKFGNPTPNKEEFGFVWQPVQSDNCFYVDFGNEITLKSNPEFERMAVWQKLLQFYKRDAGLCNLNI